MIQNVPLLDWPLSNERVVNELKKRGIRISAYGVRSSWLRHDGETFAKQLKALSAKVAQESLILMEDQMRALERAKEEKQAYSEIETEHPSYLGRKICIMRVILKGAAESISKPNKRRATPQGIVLVYSSKKNYFIEVAVQPAREQGMRRRKSWTYSLGA